MAITFVGSANGGTGSSTSFSIIFPEGIQVGDLLILEFTHRGIGNGTITGVTGWAAKHKQFYGAGSPQDFTGHTLWKIATDSDFGSPSPTVTVSNLINASAGILTVYRGAGGVGSPTEPLNEAAVVGEENASANETQAGITTVTPGAWVVLVVVNTPDLAVSSGACTDPGALTERAEVLSTAGTDASISHWSAEKANAGDTGNFTWSQTNAASGSWAYAITPFVAPATGTASITESGDTVSASGSLEPLPGPHDPGPLARLGQIAVGTSKYGSFSGKEQFTDSRTGAAAITEQPDTVSSAGAVLITGQAALLEAPDTVSGSGGSSLVAAAAIVEAPDLLSASGAVSVTGAALITEDADTVSAAGGVPVVVVRKGRLGQFGVGVRDYVGFEAKAEASAQPITASSSITEVGDTVSAAASVFFAHDPGHITRPGQFGVGLTAYGEFQAKSGSREATAAIVEAADQVTSSGAVAVTAQAAIAERPDTLSAATAVAVVATAAILERPDTVASEGGGATFAQAAIQEAPDGVSAAATVAVIGTAAVLEQPDFLVAAAAAGVVGIASLLEGSDIVVSTASVAVVAAAAITEAPDTVAAQGLAGAREITALITEAPDTVVAFASGPYPGTVSGSDRGRHRAGASDGRRHRVTGSTSRRGVITPGDGI